MKFLNYILIFLFSMPLVSQPRVVVLEFVNKSLAGHSYWWDDKVGAAAQDMLITELVKSKNFRVIEREQLESIIFINMGSAHNVKPVDTFGIYKVLKEIKDPDTGEVLGKEEKKVGEIRVTQVKGEKLSEATLVSGNADSGDVVK